MRTLATQEAVASAIAQIEAQGQTPTVERVHAITGGSYSTILKNMWPQKVVKTPDESVGFDLPEEVLKVLGSLNNIIGRALTEARAEERRSAQAEIDTIRSAATTDSQNLLRLVELERANSEALAEQLDRLRPELENVQRRAISAEAQTALSNQQYQALLARFEAAVTTDASDGPTGSTTVTAQTQQVAEAPPTSQGKRRMFYGRPET